MSNEGYPEEDFEWTKADEMGEEWEEQHIKRGGGGGRSKKKSKKSQRQGKKTLEAQENRRTLEYEKIDLEEAVKALSSALDFFPSDTNFTAESPSRFVSSYLDWLNSRLGTKSLSPEEESFAKTKFSRPQRRAGGQAANKSNAKAYVLHINSNRWAIRDEDDDRNVNEREAKQSVVASLENDLKAWRDYLRYSVGMARTLDFEDIKKVKSGEVKHHLETQPHI